MRIMKKIGDKLDNKKAQAAMEYLTTYGWAVLVVLIVLSALFYLGVFSPKPTGSCFVTAPFICRDSIANENSVGLLLTGKNVNTVTVNNIKVNGADCVTGMNGQVYTDTSLSGFDSNQQVWVRCVGITNTVGNKITSEVTLNYQKKDGLQHSIIASSSRTGETGKGTFDLSHVIDSNIVLSYDFENVAIGPNGVIDLSGKNSGTKNNGVDCSSNSNGKFGYYCSFDGSSGYINVPSSNSLNFGSGDFSIETWIKADVISTVSIVNKRDNLNTLGYEFGLTNVPSTSLRFYLGVGITSWEQTLGSFTDTVNWNHIVFVFDRNMNVTAYKNGQSNGNYVFDSSTRVVDNGQPLYLGYRPDIVRYLQGKLDSVVIYNRALTLSEIQDHYCYTNTPTLFSCT